MPSKCVECDHLLVDDEVEYIYKGKSYCDDCYRMAKRAEGLDHQSNSPGAG